jgi:hypothetical protein
VQERAGERPRDVCAFFAKRLGLEITRPPNLTNGEVMRAAGVDVATYHTWIYHGGELPESALKKLDVFFSGLAKK